MYESANKNKTKVYLYVKELNGIKYFGKTTRKDPFKYKGSGSYWRRIINKYGEQNIKTLEIFGFDCIQEAKEFAIKFSHDNDIVKSNDWANLVPEMLDGGDTSASPKYKIGIKNRILPKGPRPEWVREKMRKPKKNKENYKGSMPGHNKGYFYINNQLEEKRIPLSSWESFEKQGFVKGRIQHHCVKCNKSMDWQNFKKYHSHC